MSLFVEGARGYLTAQERDHRVRLKLESVIRSAGIAPPKGSSIMEFSPVNMGSVGKILDVCERLVNLVAGATEGMRMKLLDEGEVVEDWEDLAAELGSKTKV